MSFQKSRFGYLSRGVLAAFAVFAFQANSWADIFVFMLYPITRREWAPRPLPNSLA